MGLLFSSLPLYPEVLQLSKIKQKHLFKSVLLLETVFDIKKTTLKMNVLLLCLRLLLALQSVLSLHVDVIYTHIVVPLTSVIQRTTEMFALFCCTHIVVHSLCAFKDRKIQKAFQPKYFIAFMKLYQGFKFVLKHLRSILQISSSSGFYSSSKHLFHCSFHCSLLNYQRSFTFWKARLRPVFLLTEF